MKKSINLCLLVGLLLLLPTFVFCQTPQSIPYQAVARNSSGNLLSNQLIGVRFIIRNLTSSGTIVYRETHSTTTNSLGLFTLNIGTGTPTLGTFTGINWGTGAKFLQVDLDPSGGSSYTTMGTTQMMSVPYALYAENANVPGVAGPGYAATSATTLTLSGGSKTLTTQSGLAYLPAMRVRLANSNVNYMEGTVTSYSGTSLVVSIDRIVGAGTFTVWNIGIAGDAGATGATGAAGATGPAGSANISGTTNQIIKFTGATTGGNSIITDNGTNIGIGTASPVAKLDVNSSANNPAQFNGLAPMFLGLYEGSTYRGYLGSYSGAAEDVDFGTGAGNTAGKVHLTIQANPRLTIGSTGKVGIGTTNPAHLLHVDGGDLFVNSSSGLIRFGYNGSNEWQLATTGAGADLRWYTTTDGGSTFTPRHYFSQNGNVGFGGYSGAFTPIARLSAIGLGTTSSTNTFILQNSLLDTLVRVRDDGRIGIGYNGTSYGRTLNLGGTGINLYTANEVAFGGAIFPTDTSLVLWSNSNANNYLVLQPSWGNTGIGTYTPNAKFHLNGAQLIGSNSAVTATGYELSVDGDIIAESVVVQNSTAWPDYVFDQKYQLMPLSELEQSIQTNKHLPRIPAASEMESNGINLGNMAVSLTEKVEELTLYIIELNKKNEELSKKLIELETQISTQQKK